MNPSSLFSLTDFGNTRVNDFEDKLQNVSHEENALLNINGTMDSSTQILHISNQTENKSFDSINSIENSNDSKESETFEKAFILPNFDLKKEKKITRPSSSCSC